MTKDDDKKIIKRQHQGEVVSTKGNKTINVLVSKKKWHSKYEKQYRVDDKYPVHDEKQEAGVGDIVLFEECRPISKTKRWRLIKIVKKNK
ncbi:MAG: 30S ribosomal protein S17 [Candidatus Magasanikbacteria bacterium]|nr:30S ribosomal protein S17 [Candidatus Magasanikbacteria bacterium]